ncbi:eukaryotic translation initiation factor 2 beta [Perkinsela sp. CCAP 1560/4]|nr:eukaryotic translation initiation factor 2 beta [Perkinsela sp. CCAP 1560/4]|eukprot:KNH03818.1 eukaryotic translation initiation factor 2 beta [Perkinsela sp. CCAP 1560/4]
MFGWTDTQVAQLGCCIGGGVFLFVEIRKRLLPRGNTGSDKQSTTTFSSLSQSRILPVFRSVLSSFSLSLLGYGAYLFEPRIPKVFPLAFSVTCFLLNIALPVQLLQAPERQGCKYIFALCMGYAIGPLCRAASPLACTAAFLVCTGSLVCHIWCADNFQSLSGYAVSVQLLTPCCVVPSLIGIHRALGGTFGRPSLWLGGMYLWNVFLIAYVIFCAKWDSECFDTYADSPEQMEERDRVICRDSMTLFVSPFVGSLLLLRFAMRRLRRHVNNQLKNGSNHTPSRISGLLRDATGVALYTFCVSGLTLYIRNRHENGLRIFDQLSRIKISME